MRSPLDELGTTLPHLRASRHVCGSPSRSGCSLPASTFRPYAIRTSRGCRDERACHFPKDELWRYPKAHVNLGAVRRSCSKTRPRTSTGLLGVRVPYLPMAPEMDGPGRFPNGTGRTTLARLPPPRKETATTAGGSRGRNSDGPAAASTRRVPLVYAARVLPLLSRRRRRPTARSPTSAWPRSRSPGRGDAVVVRRAKQSSRAVRNTGLALPLADKRSRPGAVNMNTRASTNPGLAARFMSDVLLARSAHQVLASYLLAAGPMQKSQRGPARFRIHELGAVPGTAITTLETSAPGQIGQ